MRTFLLGLTIGVLGTTSFTLALLPDPPKVRPTVTIAADFSNDEIDQMWEKARRTRCPGNMIYDELGALTCCEGHCVSL